MQLPMRKSGRIPLQCVMSLTHRYMARAML